MAVETAKVVMLSDVGAFAAIQVRNGAYTVMISDGPAVSIGDEVRGELSALGDAEVQNLTVDRPIRVSIDDWDCSRVRALDRIREINSPKRVAYARGYP